MPRNTCKRRGRSVWRERQHEQSSPTPTHRNNGHTHVHFHPYEEYMQFHYNHKRKTSDFKLNRSAVYRIVSMMYLFHTIKIEHRVLPRALDLLLRGPAVFKPRLHGPAGTSLLRPAAAGPRGHHNAAASQHLQRRPSPWGAGGAGAGGWASALGFAAAALLAASGGGLGAALADAADPVGRPGLTCQLT